MIQLRTLIALASLLVLANGLPRPLDDDKKEVVSDSRIIVINTDYLRQTAPAGGILGALGTALVPVVGGLIGPILTNLAFGITQAFNNGINNGTSRPRPSRPSRRPNRRPARPNRPFQLDIQTDGLPEFEGFMINLPGVDHPYLLLAPPGSDLTGLPFNVPDGYDEDVNLNSEKIVADGQTTIAETSEIYEQPDVSAVESQRPTIKLKRNGFYFK